MTRIQTQHLALTLLAALAASPDARAGEDPPGAVITGTVRAAGQPVAGVKVSADRSRGSQLTHTHADGSFRIAGLSPGRWTLNVQDTRYESSSRLLTVEGEVSHDVELTPLCEIHGSVLAPDGAGVPGAAVCGDRGNEAATNADGSFVLMEKCSIHRLIALKEGYGHGEARIIGSRGLVRNATIPLTRGATLSGTLRGLSGDELRDAKVRAYSEGAYGSATTPASTVDSAGRYRLTGLDAASWKVIAWTGTRIIRGWTYLKDGQQTVQNLAFPPVAEITGRVSGPDGAPVADAIVAFAGDDRKKHHPAIVDSILEEGEDDIPNPSTRTADDGSFSTRLADDRYEVTVDKAGFAHGRTQTRIAAGKPAAPLEIRLQRGLVVRGRCVGLPPGAVPEVIEASGPFVRAAKVGEDGSYAIADLGPGDWTLTADYRWHDLDGPRRRTAVGRVHLAEESVAPVDLDFHYGTLTLKGTTTSPDKVNLAVVALVDPVDHTPVTDQEIAGEPFRFPWLTPGVYRLMIWDRWGNVLHEENVDLTADREIAIALPPAGPEILD